MAVASEVSRRVGGRADSPLSAPHAERLRARLLAELDAQSALFAQQAATLEALSGSSCNEWDDRDRAMAALSMYVAYEAMQEIADAVARIDDGTYGMCPSCERPISVESLEASPAARFCLQCRTANRHVAAC